MRKRRPMFLSDYIANQYPIEDFKELIFIALDITENFLLALERGFDYNSGSIASYGRKYGTSKRSSNSKIESIYIKNMREEYQMEQFLDSFFGAFKSLNPEEQEIFNATFIEKMTDLEIIDKYNTHSNRIRTARKSAIVRFTLKSGLDKFIDLI